jgi:hypothetical protein
LVILEYCKEEDVLDKENYYLNHPDYNILQFARSSYGYIHTEEAVFLSRQIPVLNESREKRMRAMHKLRKQVSEETRAKKSLSNPHNKKVEVTDIEKNTTVIFHSFLSFKTSIGLE